jgi:hypothetical protein
MQLISLNEHSTPLTEEQIDQLNKLVQNLSPDLLHHAKVFLLFPAGIPRRCRSSVRYSALTASYSERMTLGC